MVTNDMKDLTEKNNDLEELLKYKDKENQELLDKT